MNPNDDAPINTLWHVQSMRYENAINSGLFDGDKNMGMITAGKHTPNPKRR